MNPQPFLPVRMASRTPAKPAPAPFIPGAAVQRVVRTAGTPAAAQATTAQVKAPSNPAPPAWKPNGAPPAVLLASRQNRMQAPPVYNPFSLMQRQVQRQAAKNLPAPPVYRPVAPPIQRHLATSQPQPKNTAPPVYRPGNVSQAKPAAALRPAPASVIQRTVAVQTAQTTLSDIMTAHGLEAWYQANWGKGKAVTRIATEVATMADTDKDNLRSRLQAHAEIAPLLRAVRIQPETPAGIAALSAEERDVYDAVNSLTFYHVSEHHAGVRATGLDPNRGGKAGGFAAERSTAGQKAKNVANSKNKVFVTRNLEEVRQYADGHTDHVVRVIVPPHEQAAFATDPDSQRGLSHTAHLTHTDTPSRLLDWWGYSYASHLLPPGPAKDNFATLYTGLAQSGAFGPVQPETEQRLPGPAPIMDAEQIIAALLAKFPGLTREEAANAVR